jgi:hypothetical protein
VYFSEKSQRIQRFGRNATQAAAVGEFTRKYK